MIQQFIKKLNNRYQATQNHTYLRIIISLLGLIATLNVYFPVAIFYSIHLDWNIDGLVLRFIFLAGLVFLVSYFWYMFTQRKLLWILLNSLVLLGLIGTIFYFLSGHMEEWYYYSPTRIWNKTLDVLINFGFYSMPIISALTFVMALLISILVIYRTGWLVGISFTIVFVFSCSFFPSFMFYLLQKPLIGDIDLSPEVHLIAKSPVLEEERETVPTIDIDMKDARDIIVLPDKQFLFICFGSTIELLSQEHDLFIKINYGIDPIEYQIFRDKGSIKRAILSQDETKIYLANWWSGTFYVFETETFELINQFEIENNYYYLVWEEHNGEQVPRYIREEGNPVPDNYIHSQRIIDVCDFYVDETHNELILLFDTIPLIQKYKVYWDLGLLKLQNECNLLHYGAGFGTGATRMYYDKIRNSYFIIPYNSNEELWEVDGETFEVIRAVSPYPPGATNFFIYNPSHRSFYLSSMTQDILYEISLETLEIIKTYDLPRGLRKGYFDQVNQRLYFLDYFLGKFYVFSLTTEEIEHSYDIGRKPIALDVHPDIDRAFFVSSYGVMWLDLPIE